MLLALSMESLSSNKTRSLSDRTLRKADINVFFSDLRFANSSLRFRCSSRLRWVIRWISSFKLWFSCFSCSDGLNAKSGALFVTCKLEVFRMKLFFENVNKEMDFDLCLAVLSGTRISSSSKWLVDWWWWWFSLETVSFESNTLFEGCFFPFLEKDPPIFKYHNCVSFPKCFCYWLITIDKFDSIHNLLFSKKKGTKKLWYLYSRVLYSYKTGVWSLEQKEIKRVVTIYCIAKKILVFIEIMIIWY